MNNEVNSCCEFSVKPIVQVNENGVEKKEEFGCFNTFFGDESSSSSSKQQIGNFLTSSPSSSTSSSPLSPLSPLVSNNFNKTTSSNNNNNNNNNSKVAIMARNKPINAGVHHRLSTHPTNFESPRPTRAKRQVPSHLALYNNSTSSALQSISELPQTNNNNLIEPINQTITTPRLIPINLLVEASHSADSSDEVFNSVNSKILTESQTISTNNESTNTSNNQNHKDIMNEFLHQENESSDSQQTIKSIESPTSLKLKRSQAFSDLPNMDELSSVTFVGSVISTTCTNKCDSPCREDINDDSNHVSYVEEKKFVIKGIKVRAAKISKLVQILLDSFDSMGKVLPSTDFPRVFILMHKWFMESITLIDILFDLYNLYNQYQDYYQQEADKQYYANQQLKICHAFNFWLKNFPFHFAADCNLLESVKRFTNLIHLKKQKEHLKFVDITNIESYDWMRKLTMRHPLNSKQKITLAFNKIEPEVLANQLTFLEWKTLRRINFSDYKTYAIKGSIIDNPPLEKSIQLFNGLSQWIQCMVLSKATPKQRADIIHKFIEVAQHLRNLQNFNSLMAVIGGICHSALARLTKTNLHLSLEDQKLLNDFMELLSSNFNYGLYRKTINEVYGFYIPIIGIHLKDLISLHTAHLDKLENDLINFRKMAQLSVIFQSLTDLQNSAPPVQENRDLIKLLQLSLDMSYSEDEMYELSLAREPRTSVSSPNTPTGVSPFADWAKSLSTPLDPQTIQKHVNAMVDAVYKNYDHDKDGFISHDEFYEIAQNFPFIDTFTVLDADKDGMISKIEMKAYFLKANYNALKSEFKHEFHETTYFKLTFCTHCDGLLWGLIKQGWKCKDCGISAHRLCKERVVIECRPKRANNNNLQIAPTRNSFAYTSNLDSSSSILRNRSISISNRSSGRKKISFKQKSTQTDIYDDLFLSDDSLTSNEESNLIPIDNSNADHLRKHQTQSIDTNTITSFTDSIINSATYTQRTARRHLTKKSTNKRRKSMPPQNSFTIEQHAVTLIPRGPLICSNNESGLETHFFGKHLYSTGKNDNAFMLNQKIIINKQKQQKPYNLSLDNNSINETTSQQTKTLASPEIFDHEPSLIKTMDSKSTSTTNEQQPKTTIIKSTEENQSNLTEMSDLATASSRSMIYSDYEINEYIGKFKDDDNLIDDAFSSNSNEEDNDVFYKLKEEGEKRLKLERENAKLKYLLESTNAQITSLKEEMSIIKSFDSLIMQNKKDKSESPNDHDDSSKA